MKRLKNILNFFVYGNLWIGVCAAASVLQTQLLLTGNIEISNTILFVFFSTVTLYGLHRVFGMEITGAYFKKGRFKIISSLILSIFVITFIGGVLSLYFFAKLEMQIKLAFIIPSILSLAYVVPVFKNNKRLRDLSYVKIFVIAVTWAWISVVIPYFEISSNHLNTEVVMMSFERFFFIFAITIPFDIRDLKIDAGIKLKTIPVLIGVKSSKIVSIISLVLMSFFGVLNYSLGFYTLKIALIICFVAIISGIFVKYAGLDRDDLYFSGMIDGLMVLQFFLLFVLR